MWKAFLSLAGLATIALAATALALVEKVCWRCHKWADCDPYTGLCKQCASELGG
jgi:hypothetical protein